MDFLAFLTGVLGSEWTSATIVLVIVLLILFGWLIPKWSHEKMMAAERSRGDGWETAAKEAQATLQEVYQATFAQSRETTATAVAMFKGVAPMPVETETAGGD